MSYRSFLYLVLIVAFATANEEDSETWSHIEFILVCCLVALWACIALSCLFASLYYFGVFTCCSKKKAGGGSQTSIEREDELQCVVVKTPQPSKPNTPIEFDKKDEDIKEASNRVLSSNAINPKSKKSVAFDLPKQSSAAKIQQQPPVHKFQNAPDVKTPPNSPDVKTPEDIRTAKENDVLSTIEDEGKDQQESSKGCVNMSSTNAEASSVRDGATLSRRPSPMTEKALDNSVSLQKSVERLKLLVKALTSARKTPENAALLRESKALLETKQNKLKELAARKPVVFPSGTK